MSKATIVSFIADIKLTPDNQVKILELGPVFWSGFSGLKRLTGENPVEKYIFPFYESFGIPVYKATKLNAEYTNDIIDSHNILPKNVMPVAMWDNFSPDAIASHAAIIMRDGYSYEEQRDVMKEELYNRFIVTDQNNLVNACSNDKSLFYALARDLIPDILPKQEIYVVGKKGEIDTAQITKDFEGHDFIVLKAPASARGEGIDIADMNQPISCFNSLRSTKNDNIYIAQELVTGKPVTAENKNGKTGEYDPAIRVLMTAWHDKGQTHIKCHTAYCKLPGYPIAESRSRENTLSDIHYKKGPKSALVSDGDKNTIFKKLEDRLPVLFNRLFTEQPIDLVRSFLESNNEGLKCAGVKLATDARYFDQQDSEAAFPQDVTDTIMSMKSTSSLLEKTLKSMKPKPDWKKLRKVITEVKEASGTKSKWLDAITDALATIVLLIAFIGAGIFMLSQPISSAVSEDSLKTLFNGSASDFEVNTIENLRSKRYYRKTSDADATIHLINQTAKDHGYELCLSDNWRNRKHGGFYASKIASSTPDEQFVRIDINVDDKEYPSTLIYGTSCPDLD